MQLCGPGREMLRLTIVLGAAIAAGADESAPAPLLAGADEPSFWAFYPHQRCAGGGAGAALLQLTCDVDAGSGTERQACKLARACRRSRAPADCRAACLAAGSERCGGYDTRGRLFAAAACTGEFSRVAGEGDLFVRQSQPLEDSGSDAVSSKIKHMVVLYMENRCVLPRTTELLKR